MASQRRNWQASTSTAPYTLKPLIEDVPLCVDGDTTNIRITCVDYWEANLYIGTSAGEILHFVSLPEEIAGSQQQVTFILASRLEPPSTRTSSSSDAQTGVQQILILPRINRACILCNGVVTFYSLPELSPAYGGTKISGCTWIGGRDLDIREHDTDISEVLMVCVKSRIRLIRLGNDPQPRLVKNIEYPGCLAAVRRSRFACVADSQSYALLDVENQQKIPLFPISSVNDTLGVTTGAQPESVRTGISHQTDTKALSTVDSNTPFDHDDVGGHSRSTSLGGMVGKMGQRHVDSRSISRDRPVVSTPEGRPGSPSPQLASSPKYRRPDGGSPTRRPQSVDATLFPQRESSLLQSLPSQRPLPLAPHINSHLSTEFLLTTGTSLDEPGVGIFVNCDGDVVRGTLEFSSYPNAIVVDGGATTTSADRDFTDRVENGYVLAVVKRSESEGHIIGLEIQRWDSNTEDDRGWLPFKVTSSSEPYLHAGLSTTTTATEVSFTEVGGRIEFKRLRMPYPASVSQPSEAKSGQSSTEPVEPLQEWEETRSQQEAKFAGQLGRQNSQVVTWQGACVQWVVRNPLALRLDAMVDHVLDASFESRLDQGQLVRILRGIKNHEAGTETEFLSLQYIRQKICIILFADLAANRVDVNQHITEKLFVEGALDPRVILSMVPLLRPDIVEGPKGIWIHAGLISLMKRQLATTSVNLEPDEVLSRPEEYDILSLIKRYLGVWRQRKGFGSIADEAQVFSTVDAALLHILLYQDQQTLLAPGGSSVRAELYSVVDHDVDCFERAVQLLEQFHRLYVLSRLYQSRKMTGKVLATWRRIIDGEIDDGGELRDGENEVRKYLVKIKDLTLIEEYGTWLARRNPFLGVQVFTDNNSRAKLPPHQVVELLQLRAPDAVKVYLEHLVFGKKSIQYADRLISYYLDNVLTVLQSSEDARSTLTQSYESYRALHPPKPTYRQFIIDNAIEATWWHDRLRLLELLGGSHGAGFSYDVAKIQERIESFENALVPESIILDGRQGRHQQALRLLTHGLGDYHTAINYCLLGGSSIFHPTSGLLEPASVPSNEEQMILFRHLLHEFLRIEDASDRLERSSQLLERFSPWFDVSYVLAQIPDSWSVQLVSAFLVSAFRRLVHEKNEATITKALSSAQNLKICAGFIEKCDQLGPQVESVR